MFKVAIIGPESTGKSTLALALARHFNTVWVPEYARYYCTYLKDDPVLQDEINMFYGQIALEESLVPLAGQLIIFVVTHLDVKGFCEGIFGEFPDFIKDEINKLDYDIYLFKKTKTPSEA